MALSYVGGKIAAIPASVSTTNMVSLTDLIGGSDTAPLAGDIVIVGFVAAGLADVSLGVTTSGYTEEQENYGNDTRDANLSVSWKIMGGTPDTEVEVSGTGSTDGGGAVAIEVWRGVDQATPMDVTRTSATGQNVGQPNPASITPTTTGAVGVFVGAASGASSNTNPFTSSDLSNFKTLAYGDPTYDPIIGMGSVAWSGSGAIDPAAFGGGSLATNDAWASVSLVLRPDASSVPNITVNSGTHAHSAASPSLAAKSNIVVGSAVHAHSATSPTLKASGAPGVTPANAVHAHLATSPGLSARSSVAVASASHSHSAGSPVLTALRVAANDATHAHGATAPPLSARSAITVAGAAHGHAATVVIVRAAGWNALPPSEGSWAPAGAASGIWTARPAASGSWS